MPRSRNPFLPPEFADPFDDEVEGIPLGNDIDLIRDLTSDRPSQADAIAKVLTANEESEDADPDVAGSGRRIKGRDKGKPGFDREGNPLTPEVFQKGFLKGVDKTVFLGLLADTLSGIAGRPSQKAARTAIELRDRQKALRQRQKEIEETRDFERDQRELDRQFKTEETKRGEAKVASEREKQREFEAEQTNLRIEADREQAERNNVLEQEALELRAKHGLQASAVEEVFRDAATFPGLAFPPDVTPEAAFDDPAVLERARQIVAPFRERRILQQLAQTDKAAAREAAKINAAVKQNAVLWRLGRRMPTDLEIQAGATPGTPVKEGPTLEERLNLTVEALQPNKVANREINRADREEVQDALVQEFMLAGGGVFFSLDGELQEIQKGAVRKDVGDLWDAAVARRLIEIRRANVEGELVPGATPQLTPQEKAEAERRARITDRQLRGKL